MSAQEIFGGVPRRILAKAMNTVAPQVDYSGAPKSHLYAVLDSNIDFCGAKHQVLEVATKLTKEAAERQKARRQGKTADLKHAKEQLAKSKSDLARFKRVSSHANGMLRGWSNEFSRTIVELLDKAVTEAAADCLRQDAEIQSMERQK